MNTMIEKRLEEISEMTATPTSQLKFLSDAWAQVQQPSTRICIACIPSAHMQKDTLLLLLQGSPVLVGGSGMVCGTAAHNERA